MQTFNALSVPVAAQTVDPGQKDAARPTPAPNRQIDGTPTNMGTKPTRASLQDRSASPPAGRSGMEQAMGALADKLHAPKFKGRR